VAIKIDFTGVSDTGFEPIEDGEYTARIAKIEYQEQYNSLNFTFDHIEGLDDNRQTWAGYSMKPQALWRLKADLKNIGVEVPDGEFDLDADELIGDAVIIKLVTRPHYDAAKAAQGKTLQDVSIIGRSESGAFGW
jgi:hypothetical protein